MKTVKTGFLTLLAVAALLFAGATMVQAEDPDGVGDVLVYPLYLADSAAFTEFTLVNTSDDNDTSVHIQIRSQGNSQDQLDFCVTLTPNDVYKAKIFASGDGAELETLNNTDDTDDQAPDKAGLTVSDTSDCAYSPQKGYIVAYAVTDCDNQESLVQDAEIMGNVRIIETATCKIMAMNAVAIEADETDDNFTKVQEALKKDELYMIWEYEKTAAVLTVPSLGTSDPTNDNLLGELVGADPITGEISNKLCGCGLAQIATDFEILYDLDENEFKQQSPSYYPANEVSIVNFADAGLNTDDTNFFINGSAKYWGLNFTSDTLEEGWTRWTIPKDLDPQHNVVCTYFISTNNSLAWMPCQYEVCSGK
jgi:hypothetical protein